MLYLILGVVCNGLLFLAFRSYSIFKIDNMQAIVVNYIVCVITGVLFIGKPDIFSTVDLASSWSWVAIIIGILLISGFYVSALTAQKAGVSITSVASKMSMIFPILFSLFVLKIDNKDFSFLNYVGMFLAALSIYLGSLRQNTGAEKITNAKMWMLPFSVFVIGGLIDIFINYSNHALITTENEEVFPILLFAFAAVSGLIVLLIQRPKVRFKNVIGGIYLGIPNYFSIYFVFKALTIFQNNGAVFFPIYNVGIILLSSFAAMLIFKEKLSSTNFLGLGLSILALFLLSYQDIITFFS